MLIQTLRACSASLGPLRLGGDCSGREPGSRSNSTTYRSQAPVHLSVADSWWHPGTLSSPPSGHTTALLETIFPSFLCKYLKLLFSSVGRRDTSYFCFSCFQESALPRASCLSIPQARICTFWCPDLTMQIRTTPTCV